MKRVVCIGMLCAVFFSGCSIWSSTYVQVTPSSRQTAAVGHSVPAESNEQLLEAMEVLHYPGLQPYAPRSGGLQGAFNGVCGYVPQSRAGVPGSYGNALGRTVDME